MGRILGLLFTCLLCADATAQLFHPPGKLPGYSTVSIRPSDPSATESHGSLHEGTYRAQRITVRELIAYAFGLGFEQELVNAPAWVLSDHFDVEAKLVEDQLEDFKRLGQRQREEQMRLMMQSTLAERFQLTYHFATRSLPVFELHVARGGFKCPLDTTSPAAIADISRPHFRWYNAPAPPPPTRDAPPPALEPALKLRTKGWPFWLVVTWLSHQPELEGRPVVDKTGLDSSYDCQMTWAHDQSEEAAESFFPALQNQLGLKLQPAKDPIEVLVVDSIRKPSDN